MTWHPQTSTSLSPSNKIYQEWFVDDDVAAVIGKTLKFVGIK
jgi:hypothetical protein